MDLYPLNFLLEIITNSIFGVLLAFAKISYMVSVMRWNCLLAVISFITQTIKTLSVAGTCGFKLNSCIMQPQPLPQGGRCFLSLFLLTKYLQILKWWFKETRDDPRKIRRIISPWICLLTVLLVSRVNSDITRKSLMLCRDLILFSILSIELSFFIQINLQCTNISACNTHTMVSSFNSISALVED